MKYFDESLPAKMTLKNALDMACLAAEQNGSGRETALQFAEWQKIEAQRYIKNEKHKAAHGDATANIYLKTERANVRTWGQVIKLLERPFPDEQQQKIITALNTKELHRCGDDVEKALTNTEQERADTDPTDIKLYHMIQERYTQLLEYSDGIKGLGYKGITDYLARKTGTQHNDKTHRQRC